VTTLRPVTTQVLVDGRRARYRVDGDGPPVLLLHGIGRSLEDWTEQHELLRDSFRVYSVDLAGSGYSAPLPGRHDIPGLAGFVEGFLDALGVTKPVHLVGNSLGGAVAMRLTVRAPQRVTDLVLVDSAGLGPDVALGLRLLTVPLLGRAMTRARRTTARTTERLIFHDPAFVTPERIRHALDLAAEPHAARVYIDTARSGIGVFAGQRAQWRDELLTELARLDVPVLAVWGEHDRVLPAAHLETVRARLPGARTRLVPGAGHMPQVEWAEQFSACVREFWSGTGQRGTRPV